LPLRKIFNHDLFFMIPFLILLVSHHKYNICTRYDKWGRFYIIQDKNKFVLWNERIVTNPVSLIYMRRLSNYEFLLHLFNDCDMI